MNILYTAIINLMLYYLINLIICYFIQGVQISVRERMDVEVPHITSCFIVKHLIR